MGVGNELIILRELMCTLGAFIEHGGSLVDTPQLHGVEVQFVVVALGARLLDGRMLGLVLGIDR